MKKARKDVVTPFDWQRYTASAPDAAAKPPSRAKKLTTDERVERILARRWGNPYSKPGAA